MNKQPDINATQDAESLKKNNNTSEPTEELSLKEVIQEQATEDEAPLSGKFSLKKILGGDLLNTATIRQQVWLPIAIAAKKISLRLINCKQNWPMPNIKLCQVAVSSPKKVV